MSDGLDRDELISLLETLGSENDEEALAAARVLHGKVSAAGVTWDALLAERSGGPEDESEEEEAGLDLGDLGDLDKLPGDSAAKNAESLKLIGKLLAKSDISEDLRRELEDYKTDIAENDFSDSDHRYLRALCKRLSA